MRRLIEGGADREPYRDDPEASAAENGRETAISRVQPSALGGTPNEWADATQDTRDARVSMQFRNIGRWLIGGFVVGGDLSINRESFKFL